MKTLLITNIIALSLVAIYLFYKIIKTFKQERKKIIKNKETKKWKILSKS